MSLPALSKTYYAYGNATAPATDTVGHIASSNAFLLKQFLVGNAVVGGSSYGTRNPNSLWTIMGCCDSTQVKTDGTDLWTDYTKVVWANSGSAHSWIWLRNTTIGRDIVIDANSSAFTSIRITGSRTADAPFSGGTTTAGPTSTYEYTAKTYSNGTNINSPWIADTVTSATNYAHFCCPGDGTWAFYTSRGGSGYFNQAIEMVQTTNAASADHYNTFWMLDSASATRGCFAAGNLTSNNTAVGRTFNNATGANGGLSAGNNFGGNVLNSTGLDAGTSNYMAVPIHIYTFTGSAAYRGQWPDHYHVANAPIGGSYPSAAAQTHVVVGDVVCPFPGVNLLT